MRNGKSSKETVDAQVRLSQWIRCNTEGQSRLRKRYMVYG